MLFTELHCHRYHIPGNDKAKKNISREKVSEGKSKSQALVRLRRQIVNIVWCMIKHRTEIEMLDFSHQRISPFPFSDIRIQKQMSRSFGKSSSYRSCTPLA